MTKFAITLPLTHFFVVLERFLCKIMVKVGWAVYVFTTDIFSLLGDECSRVRWASNGRWRDGMSFCTATRDTHKQKRTNEN